MTDTEAGPTPFAIQLLGRPQIVRDGSPLASPRGHKTWALFTYLVCSGAPVSRQVVAGLLFPEADDPLGALRWALSELRRVLGAPVIVGGDPVGLALPEGTVVDVDVVINGSWRDALELPGLGRRLLEGVNPSSSAAFELWFENQQRHVGAATENILHEAALASLAHDDVGRALDLASRLVEFNPLDENAQVMYVRCLASAGHVDRARLHVATCTELFRRELGVEPTSALREAAEVRPPTARPTGRVGIIAQLEAGEAAFAAGAVGAGLGILHQAVVDATGAKADDLLAQALVALGAALVHAARGGDEEGAAILHRAIDVATDAGLDELAATAHRELGYVEFLRGNYARAELWLSRARSLAGSTGEELAWIQGVRGAAMTDTGDYAPALTTLTEAAAHATATGAPRAEAWARSFLGRIHLLRGDAADARTELDGAIDIVRRAGWNSFLPWPEALLAEVDLNDGDVQQAADGFEHAFAMGCQLADPCWESLAARGLGLVAAAAGDIDRAIELMADAPRRCRRLPDAYRWVEGYGLEALADLAVDRGLANADSAVAELEMFASRHGMREMVANALILRARRGDPGAIDTAALVASGIENPVLHERVRGLTGPTTRR